MLITDDDKYNYIQQSLIIHIVNKYTTMYNNNNQ